VGISQGFSVTGVFSEDAGGVLQRGLQWWTGELKSFFPSRLRRALAGDREDLVLVAENGRIRIASTGRPTTAADPTATDTAAWQRIAFLRKGRRSLRVGLRVPQTTCLMRTIDVPAAALPNAAQILALDLERVMPFERDEIYAGHRVLAERLAPGQARLQHLIVKRVKIDPLIERLEAAGATVVSLDVVPADSATPLGLNLLGARTGRQAKPPSRLNMLLAGLAVALALSAGFVSVERHETAVADLDEQLARARNSVAAAEAGEAAAQTQQQAANAVLALRANRVEMIRILEDVTKLLPDTAWLTDLSVANGYVDMTGFAAQASALLPILEASKLFTDAALTAPVTFDSVRNQERFSFRLRLSGGTANTTPDATPGAQP
jgi:general secretion pathway protein L